MVSRKRARSALAADPRYVIGPRLGGHAPADPGRARHSPLPGFSGSLADCCRLSAATVADVIREWQGLGYNRRALNLHRAARRIADEGWPDDLTELPGVGRYTADAVARFAFDEPVLPLDTNVRRVLEQTGGEFGPASAHALMDLGATVCLARIPRCHTCPLAEKCPSRGRRFEPLRQPEPLRRLVQAAPRSDPDARRRATPAPEHARPGGDGVARRRRARSGSRRSRSLARRLVGASANRNACTSVCKKE